jgi:bacteriocin biosynthesis cyclodehydratase domain-containing protein
MMPEHLTATTAVQPAPAREYVFSPGYTAHDDGVDFCFYSVARTKGSTLRGLTAEMARSLLAMAGPGGRVPVSLFDRAPLGLPARRWLAFAEQLTKRGILGTDQPDGPASHEAGRILLCADGDFGDRAAGALSELGIDTVSAEASGLDAAIRQDVRLALLADDSYDVRLHRRMNTLAVSHGVPALYLRIMPALVEIGPLVLPGESPCFECYWQRLQAPLLAEGPAGWVAESAFTVFREAGPMTEMVWRLGIQLLATEVTRITVPGAGTPTTIGTVVRFDPDALTLRHHRVLEVPGCPSCRLAPVGPGG